MTTATIPRTSRRPGQMLLAGHPLACRATTAFFLACWLGFFACRCVQGGEIVLPVRISGGQSFNALVTGRRYKTAPREDKADLASYDGPAYMQELYKRFVLGPEAREPSFVIPEATVRFMPDEPKGYNYFRAWWPDDVATLRGVFLLSLHGGPSGPRYRSMTDFCRKNQFALVGFSGNSIQRGNVDRSVMQNALAQIGQRIGHPELPRLPFVAYGFSNGSGAPASLAIMFPERTIAWVAGHPGGSWMLTHPGLEKSIGLVVHGMKDPWFTGHDQEKVVASMRRKHDAPVGMAISPIMGHGCGIHVILKFLRSAIAMRDPRPTDDGTVTLKPIRIEDGALVEPYDKAAGGAQTLAALPYKDAASVTNMMWYPDMAFAEFVQAYAARDKK